MISSCTVLFHQVLYLTWSPTCNFTTFIIHHDHQCNYCLQQVLHSDHQPLDYSVRQVLFYGYYVYYCHFTLITTMENTAFIMLFKMITIRCTLLFPSGTLPWSLFSMKITVGYVVTYSTQCTLIENRAINERFSHWALITHIYILHRYTSFHLDPWTVFCRPCIIILLHCGQYLFQFTENPLPTKATIQMSKQCFFFGSKLLLLELYYIIQSWVQLGVNIFSTRYLVIYEWKIESSTFTLMLQNIQQQSRTSRKIP